MDYASLERCKELYELSGWKTGTWHQTSGSLATIVNYGGDVPNEARWSGDDFCPAYSLGYLIRKAGSGGGIIADSKTYTARRPSQFGAPENKDPLHGRIGWTADTPENAMCIMLIELFKVGILTKEESV